MYAELSHFNQALKWSRQLFDWQLACWVQIGTTY